MVFGYGIGCRDAEVSGYLLHCRVEVFFSWQDVSRNLLGFQLKVKLKWGI